MPKPPDLLLTQPLLQNAMGELGRAFAVHRLWDVDDEDALLTRIAPSCRFIATGPRRPVGGSLMDRLPKLEIIGNFGVGYDTVDARAAATRGIIVTNTPDVLTDEVADLAMGLLIATVRELPQAATYLRAGRWKDAPYPLTKGTLRGRKMGILGLGRIGKAIARRAEAFGLEVSYHGRSRQFGVTYLHHPTLHEMAQAVDILMVVAPGGAETVNIVNESVLKALGPHGVLINVARGTLVDEAALIEALRKGTILSAGLDVFANEPNVPEELITLSNTVLLPHVGSASEFTRSEMAQLLIDNLLSWKERRVPLTPVTETPWKG